MMHVEVAVGLVDRVDDNEPFCGDPSATGWRGVRDEVPGDAVAFTGHVVTEPVPCDFGRGDRKIGDYPA